MTSRERPPNTTTIRGLQGVTATCTLTWIFEGARVLGSQNVNASSRFMCNRSKTKDDKTFVPQREASVIQAISLSSGYICRHQGVLVTAHTLAIIAAICCQV